MSSEREILIRKTAESVVEGLVKRNIVMRSLADEADTRDAIISAFNSLLAAQPKREEGFAELNKLRELSAKASPGPWEVSGSNERGVKDAERYDTAECDLRANTAFIVASVNYVREALAASPASGEGKP